jgi:hypothetical protein
MSPAQSTPTIPGPSSEAERPSSPSYTYSFPSSRRDTDSSIGSELPISSSQLFYRLPYHGNCSACKHRYTGEIIKLPIDRNSFRGVRCSRCDSKMMGFGGNSTHPSLLSIESIDPLTHIEVERRNRTEIRLRTARSMGTIASPSLEELPESDFSRAVSRGASVHDADERAGEVRPQTAPEDASQGPVTFQTANRLPVMGNSPIRETGPSVLEGTPTDTPAPSAHNPRSLIRRVKTMLKHHSAIKSLNLKRKSLQTALKKKLKGRKKHGMSPEESGLGTLSANTEEPPTHKSDAEHPRPEGFPSPVAGHQRAGTEDNTGETPKNADDIAKRLRREYTKLRYAPCRPDCTCPSHQRHINFNHAPHLDRSNDQSGRRLNAFLNDSPPVTYALLRPASSDSYLMHTGRQFTDSASERAEALSISTSFSHAQTAVGGENVPAVSLPHPSHHWFPSLRSHSPRPTQLPPTSNPRDRNGRGTPDTTRTWDALHGRLTPEVQRHSISVQGDESGSIVFHHRPSRASTPLVNGYRSEDDGGDIRALRHYSS